MNRRCHDIEELGVLAELQPGDPRLAHVESCPHCRALLAAFRSFEQGCPSAGDDEREQALGSFLAREIGKAAESTQGQPPRGFFRLVRSRFLAPGLAVAAVLVLSFSFQQYRSTMVPDESPVTRGDEATDLHLTAVPDGTGGVLLQWHAANGAESYVAIVYTADLRELARLETAGETSLALSPNKIAELCPSPQSLLWRVEAYRAGELLMISAPSVIPATSTP